MENSQTPRPDDQFAALGLTEAIARTVAELGYEEPTAIQREAIPPLIAGRDVLGQAATGTGKTAAFSLPLLHKMQSGGDREHPAVRGFVLVPTRELAMQVAEAVHAYGKALNLRVLPIYGGQSMGQQLRALQRGVDMVIATPGRALDHIRRGTLKLSAVEMVILDEADEMLDMGFAEDLDAIVAELPATRQTALFSATLPKKIVAIAKKYLNDPVRVTVAAEPVAAGAKARVREIAYGVQRQHKVTALARVLDIEDPTSVIIFCRTRLEVDELSTTFGAHGYQADALHGGLSQEQRDRVLKNFKENVSDILIATDVAARGLDIDHVSHVVNYEVPSSPDVYVHRIGRTGRAGREGVAITLVEAKEQRLLRNIEQHTKRKIPLESVPTVHDLRMHRMEATQAQIEEALQAGEFEQYKRIAERLSENHDMLDIASAVIGLLDKAGAGLGDQDADLSMNFGATQAGGAARGGGKYAKLFINAGRKDGIGPGDLVGAIANMAQIDSRALGTITMSDRYALIDVPEHLSHVIIKAMRAAVIRGRKVSIRQDRDVKDRKR